MEESRAALESKKLSSSRFSAKLIFAHQCIGNGVQVAAKQAQPASFRQEVRQQWLKESRDFSF